MAVNFGVNYLAVVVAAVVAVIIGFIWYAPQVFGNRWMAYLGTTRAQLGQPAPSGLAAGVAGALINSWVPRGALPQPRRQAAVGAVAPEQRAQPHRADRDGGDRHRLALIARAGMRAAHRALLVR